MNEERVVMYCINCGANFTDDNKFCPQCGADVAKTSNEATSICQEEQQITKEEPLFNTNDAPSNNITPNSQTAPPSFGGGNPGYNNYTEQSINQQYFNAPVYPPYFSQNIPDPGRDFAVASLVLGIVSYLLLCAFVFGWPSTFVTTITGLVLGVKARKKSKMVGLNNGMALAGIITSAIALAFVTGICLMYLLLFITGVEMMNGEIISELI